MTKNELEEIKNILTDSLIDSNNDNYEQKQALKDLETLKIIVTEILGTKKHLSSTTNLNNRQVYDIAKAEMVNDIFGSPLIEIYINSFREHKRSEIKQTTKNLLTMLLEIGNEQNYNNDNDGSIKRILGRRI